MGSLVITAIAVMLLLSVGIVFFVVLYQRRVIKHQEDIRSINERKQIELIQASIRGEEEERMRIASELHDDVGATLSSVRLFLHAARRSSDAEILDQSRDLLDDSIRKVRNISHKLQPALLQQLGLQASLESFAAMLSKTGNITIEYSCPVPLPRLNDNVELSVYRILQELTSNILKHAHASSITIETLLLPAGLRTVIVHDGEGLTETSYKELTYKKGAIGLKNIVNRLKSVNASISFDMQGDAYRIIIETPLSEKRL